MIASSFGSLAGMILGMFLENLLDTCLDIFSVSIIVVLSLVLGNFFDKSIGSLM